MSGYSMLKRENSVVKKVIIILMIISLAFSMVSWQNFLYIFAAVATYGRTDDNLWAYKVINPTTRTVSIRPSDLGSAETINLEIPSSVIIQEESYTVEEISPYAYSLCVCSDCLSAKRSSLKSAWDNEEGEYEAEEVLIEIDELIIPDTVKTIGKCAFEYCELEKVTFESTPRLETIKTEAFWETTLKSINIPASVTTIEDSVFCGSELETITFEEGIQLTEIDEYTFEGTMLKTITLPESVTNIKQSAFYCSDLREITIPKAVTNIGYSAFEGNYKLKKVKFAADGELEIIRKGAFMECDLTEVTIPASVETIGLCAFGNNSQLHTVTLQTEDEINTLNKDAFAKVPGYNCDEDTLDDDLEFNKNTSVTQVNVENYDTYRWIANKEAFDNSANIYSKKTRVFIDERKDDNAQGDISMGEDGQKTLRVDDYVTLENGYHFEGSKFKYVDTLDLTNVNTADIEETEFVSYGYPYVVIKANQEINEYEIAYETNSDETYIENSKCQYDSAVTISSTVPTKFGYKFLGWSKSATGEGELYQPGQIVNENFTDKNGEVVKLYAKWKEIKKKVTIKFGTPKTISNDLGYEIVVTKNGVTIQQYDVDSSEVGSKQIVISGAKLGEIYTIKCTNYKKENGKKTYYPPSTKEVTIE